MLLQLFFSECYRTWFDSSTVLQENWTQFQNIRITALNYTSINFKFDSSINITYLSVSVAEIKLQFTTRFIIVYWVNSKTTRNDSNLTCEILQWKKNWTLESGVSIFLPVSRGTSNRWVSKWAFQEIGSAQLVMCCIRVTLSHFTSTIIMFFLYKAKRETLFFLQLNKESQVYVK